MHCEDFEFPVRFDQSGRGGFLAQVKRHRSLRLRVLRWSMDSDSESRRAPRSRTTDGGCSLLSCSATKAFIISLLERRGDPGAGGRVPSLHEVFGDARHMQCSWDEFCVILILFSRKKKLGVSKEEHQEVHKSLVVV